MTSLRCRFCFACGLGIWLGLSAQNSRAATGDYLIDVWMGENGLPNSSVTSIAQTPDGYLWVGTYNGLARFDGVRFVTFHPANTPALQRARVRKLYLDSAGTLWINTYDGSLTTWRLGKFTLEWKGDNSADSVATMVSDQAERPVFLLHTGELIRRAGGVGQWQTLRPPGASSGTLCVEDGSGSIWGRGRDQKLWRLKGDLFEAVPLDCGLQGSSIKCLTADARGRLWVGTEKEFSIWENGRFQTMTPTNGEEKLDVSLLFPSPNGDVWAAANGRVRRARDRNWDYEATTLAGVFASRLDRAGVLQDRAGGIWLYHYGKGIFHIRPDGQTRQVASEPNFPGERVDCLYEDREGNIWTGVDRGGLVRLRQKRFVALNPGGVVATKAAVSVAEDQDGGIWVGTYGAGFYRWYAGQAQTFAVPSDASGGFVFSLCPEAQGRMWVSAGEEDLFLRIRDRFQPAAPPVHGVKALLSSRDGRLWIGTKSGLVCSAQGQLRLFREEDGVRRLDVRALAEGAGGIIWAGSGDGTLYRIWSNHVDSFRATDGNPHPVWSLSPDADDSIWVGTFRGGLLHFENGRFSRFTTRDGLPDDVICQILDDQAGRLWIGSQQGIFSIMKEDLRRFATGSARSISCTAYGKYDGLPSLECSGGYQPAACRARDGRLLFATLKGVVSVRPEALAPNRSPPPVVIEDVLVDGRSLAAGSAGVAQAGGLPGALKVPPGKRQLEFRFTGLSFVSPDRVRFRYQLVGLDKEMIEAGTRRSVQYSFLRPGNYSFQVTACNNDGVWNPQFATLSVRILPHFYETWWFPSLVGVVAIMVVASTVRQVVVRRMRRQLEHLERQRAIERDRARIAKDIHDDLGAGLTQITLLSELARREPSEQAGPHLERISDSARKLTRAIDEIVWAVDPQHDTLSGLMDYISAYTEDFLRTAGIRCRMEMPGELPAWPVAAELRYNLFLALKEALNNVVKHAQAQEVRLGLRLDSGSFTLTVEDNGRGTLRDGKENGERLVAGHGLLNLEKRLSSVGGQCRVQGVPGEGTRVEMTVRVEAGSSPIVATVRNGAPQAESPP